MVMRNQRRLAWLLQRCPRRNQRQNLKFNLYGIQYRMRRRTSHAP